MEKTYLEVPNAHREYAVRFGATWDPIARKHFIIGAVPSELYSYIPKKPRQRNYAEEQPEQCSACGSAMVLRTNRKDGSLFYVCSAYPRCSGKKQFK